MRVLCETLLEALPESIFQLSIWKAGLLTSKDTDVNLLYVSIGISCASLFKCCYLVWDGASKRNVGMREHAWQILTLGVGFTPYISGIRKGKLLTVDYNSLQLVPQDVKRIMWALGNKKSLVEKISMRGCNLSEECLRLIGNSIEKCKTLQEIDIRDNSSVQSSGRMAVGNALLDADRSAMCKWQCDVLSLGRNDTELKFGPQSAAEIPVPSQKRRVLLRKKSSRRSQQAQDFSIGEVTLLAGLLKWNQSLTALDIDTNKVGDEGKLRLAKALCESTSGVLQFITVRHARGGWEVEQGHSSILDLSYQGLGPADCALLAGIVKVNRSIKILNLTNNMLCGAALLAKSPTVANKSSATRKTASLKQKSTSFRKKKVAPSSKRTESRTNSVSCKHQDISGLKLLCQSLSSCLPSQKLMKAQIFEQESSSKTVRRSSLSKALTFSPSAPLASPSNKSPKITISEGCHLGASPSTITQLIIDHNSLSGDAMDVIIDMLAINTTLTELNIKGNRVSSANKKVREVLV